MRRHFILLALLFGLMPAGPAFPVAVDEERLEDPALEQRAQTVFESLRCLVCQNQSIAESDAPLAKDLRELVRARIEAGDTNEEARAYVVERYGDWVLLKPPLRLETYLLWFGPILLVLFGGFVLLLLFRRPPITGDIRPLDDEERRVLARMREEERDRGPE